MAATKNHHKLKQSSCPPSFVCPLSYRVMENPFFDACGHSFEKAAIESWVVQQGTCPISRKSLTLQDLKPNYTLAERIDKYKWEKEHIDVSILKSVTPTSSDNNDNDDDDSLTARDEVFIRDDGDIEMGGHVIAKNGIKPKGYQRISADMTLLPQEREALHRIRRQNDAIKHLRACRRRCYCIMAIIAIVVFVLAIALYRASYQNV